MSGILPVQAPVAAPPLVANIFVAAQEVREGDERWLQGFRFTPPECTTDPVIIDPCEPAPPARPDGDRAGDNPITMPWVVEVADRCSAMGWQVADYAARAGRVLDAVTPAATEAEFWRGDKARARGWDNLYLSKQTDPAFVDVNAAGAVAPLVGLALLQEAIAAARVPRGHIHADVFTVGMWLNLSNANVRRDPNTRLIVDAFENIIVAGGGYDGSGDDGGAPAAGQRWAYATTPVQVRRSSPLITPSTMAEALDRAANDVVFAASRHVGATWDGCLHAGVRLDFS